MPISLYELTVPTFTRGLTTMLNIIDKAVEHAKAEGVNPDEYASAALCGDMKPFSFQVQVASNTVKKSVWRVTGDEVDSWPDDETTMAQLRARVQKTLDLLKAVDAAKIDGKEDTVVEL